MTLKKCLELGKTCGLKTPEECVKNVIYHSMELFVYDKIKDELDELYKEYEEYKKVNDNE